jgi:hypothetical protein
MSLATGWSLKPGKRQPGPPFRNISHQQLWKIHNVTVSPLCQLSAVCGL